MANAGATAVLSLFVAFAKTVAPSESKLSNARGDSMSDKYSPFTQLPACIRMWPLIAFASGRIERNEN